MRGMREDEIPQIPQARPPGLTSSFRSSSLIAALFMGYSGVSGPARWRRSRPRMVSWLTPYRMGPRSIIKAFETCWRDVDPDHRGLCLTQASSSA